MLEVLSNNPSLQEILWNFSRFNDERKRLTLKENPHFYAELPNSPETDWAGVKIDPIEDFRHANKFYVLTDKPELVHIMTDQDSQWQSFGNFWCPKNAIIFKGLGVLFVCYSFFLMSCQTPVGGSEGNAWSRNLSETHVGFASSSRRPSFQELQGALSVNPTRSSWRQPFQRYASFLIDSNKSKSSWIAADYHRGVLMDGLEMFNWLTPDAWFC